MKILGVRHMALPLLCLFLLACDGTDYNKQLESAFKKTFQSTFKSYQYYGTPLSGYGVGTMYPKAAQNAEFDPTTSGIYGDPATWWVNLSPEEEKKHYIDLFGDAETGALKLQVDRTTTFGLDVVLPDLYRLVSVNGSLDYKKQVTVTISADTAFNHRINWTKFDTFMSEGVIDGSVKRHYDAKDYLIVVGDVVLNNYKASLNVDAGMTATAKAQLTAAWKQLGNGSTAGLSFSDPEKGSYVISSTKPVVIATYTAPPPGGAVRAAETGGQQFGTVRLPDNVLKAIQSASLKGTHIRIQ